MTSVAALAFLWFPLPSVARLKYMFNALYVSEETTLQLIGILDVACIAAHCPPFTVTRVGSPTINSRPIFLGGLIECTPCTRTLRELVLHIFQWI